MTKNRGRSLRYMALGVAFLAGLTAACGDGGLRHPLDDSETRPETRALALAEAEERLDTIGDEMLSEAAFDEDTWTADGGCDTAPFAPSQGEVGVVLIRTYSEEAVGVSAEELLDDYEAYWSGEGESSSRNNPNMDPGVVSRVNGIGYELVSLPPEMELRAFVPCY